MAEASDCYQKAIRGMSKTDPLRSLRVVLAALNIEVGKPCFPRLGDSERAELRTLVTDRNVLATEIAKYINTQTSLTKEDQKWTRIRFKMIE